MIYKKYLLIPILFLALAFIEAGWSEDETATNYYLIQPPPGTVKIAKNFYCDQTEVGNIHWREYLYWEERVFGKNSKEYLAALPDTTVWLKQGPCFNELYADYLRTRYYDQYPLVGISQKQATDFAKWRSDRAFERQLIELHKLSENQHQTRENHFTIESYFNGTYKSILPGKKVSYYPEYRLPDVQERVLILYYADSVNKAYFDNCDKANCKQCKAHNYNLQAEISPCKSYFVISEPTRNISDPICAAKNDNAIYNLRGNVSEWGFEPGIAFGGGWIDTKERIAKSDTFQINTPNAWTGFRNICEWKKWKE
jgi:hypothetical protein